jgi:RNA polymerase sigma-70 factor (ECF subfamily)
MVEGSSVGPAEAACYARDPAIYLALAVDLRAMGDGGKIANSAHYQALVHPEASMAAADPGGRSPGAEGGAEPAILENDRALLEAFRRGSRDALTAVYFHYVDRVATLARCGCLLEDGRRIPGAGGAQAERDLVQETFARAFSKSGRDGYDGVRPYRPYLLRITKNLLIDRARRTRPELPLHEPATAALLDGAMILEPPDEDLDWKRLSAATRDYLASIPTELRELVRLRFEEGLSQVQAATQLSISRRRVRTLEERVQKGLEQHLRKLRLFDSSASFRDGT